MSIRFGSIQVRRVRGGAEPERGPPLPGGHVLRGRGQGHALLLVDRRVQVPAREGEPVRPLLRDGQLLGRPPQPHPHTLRRVRPPPRPRLRRRAPAHARPRPVRVRSQPGHSAPPQVPLQDQGPRRFPSFTNHITSAYLIILSYLILIIRCETLVSHIFECDDYRF